MMAFLKKPKRARSGILHVARDSVEWEARAGAPRRFSKFEEGLLFGRPCRPRQCMHVRCRGAQQGVGRARAGAYICMHVRDCIITHA